MSPRLAAVHVLTRVLQQGQQLNDALEEITQQFDNPKDSALCQALCYGVIRWYYRLDFILGQLLNRKLKPRDLDLRCLLLIGLYQLIYMRVPDHAAVSESVTLAQELKKDWARGLVNAILRNYQRNTDDLQARADTLESAETAHPDWLLSGFKEAWPKYWPRLIEANNHHPPMTLRVNILQISRQDYLNMLKAKNIDANSTLHALTGIILSQAIRTETLPGFAQGLVSVQDEAAQLAGPLFNPQPSERILDACAAPGGKTAHTLEMQPEVGELLALDISKGRLTHINENLQRLNLPVKLPGKIQQGNACSPETWWDGRHFDRILLDAPCSATGIIRRHPDIKLLRTQQDISNLAMKQQTMLKSLWPLLKPGGTLLYATCSVLPQENTEQIQRFLETTSDAKEQPINVEWGHAVEPGRQILTGEDNMDGFYYACICKGNPN